MLSKFEGRTYQEALQKCLRQLECDETELYIDIKETEDSKVQIEVLEKREVIDYIKEIIQNIASALITKINVKVSDIDDVLNVSIFSDVNPILIGKDGKNLQAIQIIVKQALTKKFNRNIKISVDVANYKNHKIKSLQNEIKRLAEEVQESKIDVKLDPMNSYERRIVHTIISEFKNLETVSEGEAPNRYVTIKYKG